MGYRNIKKQKKLISFLQIEDFDFSMSRDNAYYQFYKNAPYTACSAYTVQTASEQIGFNALTGFMYHKITLWNSEQKMW